MARFDTGHGNLEDVWGDRPAVEQWFLQLHYRRLPHVHLLVADGVQYGARGFVGLAKKSLRRETSERQRKREIIHLY